MTTCLPRTEVQAPEPHARRRRGFTLLEIVIVLLIGVVLVGGTVTVMVASSSERALKNASGEIELLAKKARTVSILHQKPYAIEFHEGSLRLLPFAEASAIELTTASGREIGGSSAGGDAAASLREEIKIDSDITLGVRRWNSSDFVTPSENFVPIWRFDPNGLSEPLTVRMTIGRSYAQDTYHPLTASIAESEMEAY